MVDRHDARLKRVAINYDTLLRLINGEVRIVHDELPKDARIVNVFHDAAANCVTYVVEHESFEGVPLGQDVPLLWPARIELAGPSCEELFLLLQLMDRQMTIEDFCEWSVDERDEALVWAAAAHLSASDHDDVDVPAIPVHVEKLPHCVP